MKVRTLNILENIIHQEEVSFLFEPREPDLPSSLEVVAECVTYDDSFSAHNCFGNLQSYNNDRHEVQRLELWQGAINVTKQVLEAAPWVYSEAEDLALDKYEQLVQGDY